ncbi:FecCD family ABC transporter permease [Pelistega suis]|uniref:FecCD family ABC transporter permease n=1 Tax=Pelistega suis TaxID=1631957 RepID=UPI00211B9244|nr:iron ABC transporter permease [Pelistega suis]MCQ9328106.1 iron ABC transporter permease [Pelistega suis]
MSYSKTSFLILLSVLLLLSTLWVTGQGAVHIPWSDIPRLLIGEVSAQEQVFKKVLIDIRLPRVILSLVAGAILAIAGVIMQALFRNPLAEPGLMGVSAGASLGAVVAIVLFGAGLSLIAPLAFLGSLGATMIAYLVGKRFGGSAGLLLAGVAINAISVSIIGILTYMANDAQLRDLTFWSMGSLATGSWAILSFLIPWALFWLISLLLQWRALNALLLGDREVNHLGFSLKALRRRLIMSVALLVGPLVAITGGIGFIGLIVPHIMRLLLGANHKYLIPASILGGALLLSLSDTVARTLVAPAELPVGLLTSLLGGPFFLYLLLRERHR